MWTALWIASLAWAQDVAPELPPDRLPPGPPPPIEAPDDAPTPDLPPIEGTVERVDGITEDQLDFLKPKRHLLEQNPYAQVDFTAYTLEWGEVMLGIAGIRMGIAPRVQLGTQPLFDLLGVYNLNAKTNPLRIGNVDVGLVGQGVYVPLGDFKGTFITGGLNGSWIVVPKFSLHMGGMYGQLNARGIPNKPPALFRAWVPQDRIDQISQDIEDLGFDPEFKANALVWRFAADYRLNRRDSIVLQAQGLGYGSVNATFGEELDPIASQIVGILVPFATDDSFSDKRVFNPAKAYAITVSWQFAWQQIGARIGGGWSADKLYWLAQGNDLNYRFWGKTRLEDRRRKKGWKGSKDEVVE